MTFAERSNFMIPLHTLYTPSHRELMERFFTPSLPGDVEPRISYFESEGDGWIQDASFRRAIVRKCEVIIAAIREHWGRVFIWSDVDVQFFGPLAAWAERTTRDLDLVFQMDAPGPCLCAGFFFCRANDATLRLWEGALAFSQQPDPACDDQVFVRKKLFGGTSGVRWGHLPPAFIGGGTFTGQNWNPGGDFPVPRGVVMHHANWTCGTKAKVAQCEFVQTKIARGDFLDMDEACRRMSTRRRIIRADEATVG